MKRHCLALDLKDDLALIKEYEDLHRQVWPEVRQSIRNAGVVEMEIYLYGNRLFMVIETEDNFSFERKAATDKASLKVQEWEELMWKYQQPIPGAKEGEKWVLMERIFSLQEQTDGVENLKKELS